MLERLVFASMCPLPCCLFLWTFFSLSLFVLCTSHFPTFCGSLFIRPFARSWITSIVPRHVCCIQNQGRTSPCCLHWGALRLIVSIPATDTYSAIEQTVWNPKCALHHNGTKSSCSMQLWRLICVLIFYMLRASLGLCRNKIETGFLIPALRHSQFHNSSIKQWGCHAKVPLGCQHPTPIPRLQWLSDLLQLHHFALLSLLWMTVHKSWVECCWNVVLILPHCCAYCFSLLNKSIS